MLAFAALSACIALTNASQSLVAVFIVGAFGLYFFLSRFLFGTKESEEVLYLLRNLLPVWRNC
jgi:hypothetical protein